LYNPELFVVTQSNHSVHRLVLIATLLTDGNDIVTKLINLAESGV